jgi:hypothetical protein
MAEMKVSGEPRKVGVGGGEVRRDEIYRHITEINGGT